MLCHVAKKENPQNIETSLPSLFLLLRSLSKFARCVSMDFSGGSEVKVSAYNAGDLGSVPGLGRCPGEGNGTPLQYSCLENPMEGGAW